MTERTLELAKGPNLAVLSTLMPDGTPQSHVVWVDTDGEHILVNTEQGRQKVRNVEADPKATVTILDRDNPYSFVEIRGRVVQVDDNPYAREHIDELSVKYTGKEYDREIHRSRVILRIEPTSEYVR